MGKYLHWTYYSSFELAFLELIYWAGRNRRRPSPALSSDSDHCLRYWIHTLQLQYAGRKIIEEKVIRRIDSSKVETDTTSGWYNIKCWTLGCFFKRRWITSNLEPAFWNELVSNSDCDYIPFAFMTCCWFTWPGLNGICVWCAGQLPGETICPKTHPWLNNNKTDAAERRLTDILVARLDVNSSEWTWNSSFI